MKLASRDVKSWLERETGSFFVPVHTKAKKLIDEMNEMIEELSNASKMLLDNSAKEIEKRNMKTYKRARALNKLARLFLDRLKQVKTPNKISYDEFARFVQDTQKALIVTEADIANWFPRISPFFIIDRRKFQVSFEKAKLQLKELGDFMTKEYVKTKTLEEAFHLIERLQVLEKQFLDCEERTRNAEGEKAILEKKIAETEGKITGLKSSGNMNRLSQTNVQMEALTTELKHSLQHLQKPFIKLQSLSLHGGGSGLTQDELKKLNLYLENPFEAFATEEAGYPILKEILGKLERLMSEKLQLKPEKERKARQAIDNVLRKDSLATLHERCREVLNLRKQLANSTEIAETQQGLSELQEHVEDLARRKGLIESEEVAMRRAQNETLEKTKHTKVDIEKSILSFMNKRVHIE